MPLNMFENVNNASVKSTHCSLKITNLAGRLIANIKSIEEQANTEDTTPAEVRASSSLSLMDEGHSETDSHCSDDVNVVISKSGIPTVSKAPRLRNLRAEADLRQTNMSRSSDSSASTVAPVKDMAPSPARVIVMENTSLNQPIDVCNSCSAQNGSEDSQPCNPPSFCEERTSDKPISGATKASKMVNLFRAYVFGLVNQKRQNLAGSDQPSKKARVSQLILDYAAQKKEKTVSAAALDHMPPSASLNSAGSSHPTLSDVDRMKAPTTSCKNLPRSRSFSENNNAESGNGVNDNIGVNSSNNSSKKDNSNDSENDSDNDGVNSSRNDNNNNNSGSNNRNANNNGSDGKVAGNPVTPTTSKRKSGSSPKLSSDELQVKAPARQIYWEQLHPNEPPVKIIVPTPKAQRRARQSRWDKLLIALGIMKDRQQKDAESPIVSTKWQRLRKAVRKYIAEQRAKSSGDASDSQSVLGELVVRPSIVDEAVSDYVDLVEKHVLSDTTTVSRKSKMARILKNYAREQKMRREIAQDKLTTNFPAGSSSSNTSPRKENDLHGDQRRAAKKKKMARLLKDYAKEKTREEEASAGKLTRKHNDAATSSPPSDIKMSSSRKKHVTRLVKDYARAKAEKEATAHDRAKSQQDTAVPSTSGVKMSASRKKYVAKLMKDYAKTKSNDETSDNDSSASQPKLSNQLSRGEGKMSLSRKQHVRNLLKDYASVQKESEKSQSPTKPAALDSKGKKVSVISSAKHQRKPDFGRCRPEQGADILRDAISRLSKARPASVRKTRPLPVQKKETSLPGQVEWLVQLRQRLNKSENSELLAPEEIPAEETPEEKTLTEESQGQLRMSSNMPSKSTASTSQTKLLKQVSFNQKIVPKQKIPMPPPIEKLPSLLKRRPAPPAINEPPTEATDSADQDPVSVTSRAKMYVKDLIRLKRSPRDSDSIPCREKAELPVLLKRNSNLKNRPVDGSETSTSRGHCEQSEEVTRSLLPPSGSSVNDTSVSQSPQQSTAGQSAVPFHFKSSGVNPQSSSDSVMKTNDSAIQTDSFVPPSPAFYSPFYPSLPWPATVPVVIAPPHPPLFPSALTGPNHWWPHHFPQVPRRCRLVTLRDVVSKNPGPLY